MKTYIYTLRREDSDLIRYVGKTINLRRRYYQHISPSSYKNSKTYWLKNWVFKALKNNVKIIIEEIEYVEGDGVYEEKYWISQFRQWGFNLVNLTEGGDGVEGLKHNEGTKLKISKANKGRKPSKKTKMLMSKAHTGFKYSEESKNKMSNAATGRKYSEEEKLSRKRTPVICIEDNKKFDYMTEAALYYNVSIGAIHNQIKGLSKKLRNGKTFKYAEL